MPLAKVENINGKRVIVVNDQFRLALTPDGKRFGFLDKTDSDMSPYSFPVEGGIEYFTAMIGTVKNFTVSPEEAGEIYSILFDI